MRRGITPVIATVILLMMAVAIAGAAFFWINVIQSRSQAAVGSQTSTLTGRTGAAINLIALKMDVVEDELELTLHNVGDSNIPSGTIAFTISDEQDYVVKSFSSNLSSNFETDSFLTLNYELNSSLIQNETYKVKVTLPGGVTLTGSASVGGSGFRVISCTSDGDCASYCVGDTRYYGGSCVNGDCVWSNSQTCPSGCSNGECNADPCDSLNCDDGNPCTIDSCSGGSCSNVAVVDGTSCSGCAGSLCACVSGVCESTCGDGNCDAWEDYSNCGLDCPANCQEVQGSCSGVWFTGSITTNNINYCACCDAVTDYFYNGSISDTTHFCYQGSYFSQGIDFNQTICEYYNYDWITNTNTTTYVFEFDALDEEPNDFPLNPGFTQGNAYLKVSDGFGSFDRVANLSFTGDVDSLYFWSDDVSSISSGVQEINFWFRNTALHQNSLSEYSTAGIGIANNAFNKVSAIWHTVNSTDTFAYTKNGTDEAYIGLVEPGTWYHYSWVLDLDNDLTNISRDGVLVVNNFKVPDGMTIDFLGILNTDGDPRDEFYFDKIDVSWDSTYDGDLLSCCGDDGSDDDFYDGFISDSINFCLDGSFFNQPIDSSEDLCTAWGYDWISNISSNNLFSDAGFESLNGWSLFLGDNATTFLNDTPGLVYNGSYSLFSQSTGDAPTDFALMYQSVASVDYLSFYVNGTLKEVPPGYYGVVVTAGGGIDNENVKKIYYLINQSGYGDLCGGSPPDSDNVLIKCLGKSDGVWHFVELNPKNDFEDFFDSYSDSYFNVYFGTQFNATAYFDDVFVGERGFLSCCGDDGFVDDFYNSTNYCCNGSFDSGSCFCGDGSCQSWESYVSCPSDCSNCAEVEGECTGVWFAGPVTASDPTYCACCGDDGTLDDFYNGTIGSTSYFCLNGEFINQAMDQNQTLCEAWGHDWISGRVLDNLFSEPGFESNNTWTQFYQDNGTVFLNDTPSLVYNGSYSAYTKTYGYDPNSVAFYAQNVDSVDYLSFFVNGSVNSSLDGWYGAAVGAGGQVFDDNKKKIYYLVGYSGSFADYCGTYPEENVTIVCLDEVDGEWNYIEVNPKSDFDRLFTSYDDSYFSIIFGTQFSGEAYFDEVRVGELTEFPCCGDDGSSDDFYNSTNYCCDGVLDTGSCFCGDGLCQDWESTVSCPIDCIGLFAEEIINLVPVSGDDYFQTDLFVANVDETDSQPELLVSVASGESVTYTLKVYNYSNGVSNLKASKEATHSDETIPYTITSGDLDGDGSQEIVVSGRVGSSFDYKTFIDVFNMSGGEIIIENLTEFNLTNFFGELVDQSTGHDSLIADLATGSKYYLFQNVMFDEREIGEGYQGYLFEYAYENNILSISDFVFVGEEVDGFSIMSDVRVGDVNGDLSNELVFMHSDNANLSVIDDSFAVTANSYDVNYESFDLSVFDLETSTSYDELISTLYYDDYGFLEIHDASGSEINTLYNMSFKIDEKPTYPISLLINDFDDDVIDELLLFSMYGSCPGDLNSGFSFYNYSDNQLNLEKEQVIPDVLVDGVYYSLSNLASYIYSDFTYGDIDEDGNLEVLSVGFLSDNPCSLNANYLNAIVVYEYRS